VTADRLTDQAVWRIVRETAMAARLRPTLSTKEREFAFGGHSLRAGLATSAEADEATVQKHLGHSSAEMTRIYKRTRDRFKAT
jgi:integrase